jgi:hypothetical protein
MVNFLKSWWGGVSRTGLKVKVIQQKIAYFCIFDKKILAFKLQGYIR